MHKYIVLLFFCMIFFISSCSDKYKKIWLPSESYIAHENEKYFLNIQDRDIDLFIKKNNLPSLDKWNQLFTTSYRGYIGPKEIIELHKNDPIMADTFVTSIPGENGYTAIYFNTKFHYLVIQK